MITYVKGDVIKAFLNKEIDVFAHGCNIYNTMGNGIAKQVKEQLPELWQADQDTVKGDRNKLGDYSVAWPERFTNQFAINMYTQATYWDSNDRLNYGAVSSCFNRLPSLIRHRVIGMPLVGAGLAGGDWKIIEQILDFYTKDIDVRVYTL